MDKKKILEALKKLREGSKQRKFVQSVDLVFSLKGLDLKKQESKVSVALILPHSRGKKPKVCAFVDKSLVLEAKKVFDFTVLQDDFVNLPKEEINRICDEYDYFIAQATIMTNIASTFGKILGPKGKMPDPKLGLVITPKTNLSELKERINNMIKVSIKKNPVLSGMVGVESMSDEELTDNIVATYNAVEKALPKGVQQISKVIVKTTMGKPVVI